MNVNRKIPIGDRDLSLECNPCRVEGSAKLTVSINGNLFSDQSEVKAVVSGQLESLLKIDTQLHDTTDESAAADLYQLRLCRIIMLHQFAENLSQNQLSYSSHFRTEHCVCRSLVQYSDKGRGQVNIECGHHVGIENYRPSL
jgi:hypothetical protein